MDKIIAVDFDDTLFENKYPDIGEPIWETINAIKKEQSLGTKIILWTTRYGKELEDAVDACSNVGITFAAINENVKQVTNAWGCSPRKVFANEYWDDKAVTVSKYHGANKWHYLYNQEGLPAVKEKIGYCEFSDYVYIKVVGDCPYPLVAYMNLTTKEWFNPQTEQTIDVPIIAWKYIEYCNETEYETEYEKALNILIDCANGKFVKARDLTSALSIISEDDYNKIMNKE